MWRPVTRYLELCNETTGVMCRLNYFALQCFLVQVPASSTIGAVIDAPDSGVDLGATFDVRSLAPGLVSAGITSVFEGRFSLAAKTTVLDKLQ